MTNVITNSGLGSQKDGEKEFGHQPIKPVVFVVVNGVDYYVRSPEHWEKGLEDSRRCFLEGIQAALDMDEMHYYEPMEEYDFRESMNEWSMATHAEPPEKFVRRSSDKVGLAAKAYKEIMGGSVPVKTYVRKDSKVGRNESCPCGSGFKHKKCCGGK